MRAELSKDEEPPCGRKLGRLPVGKEPETSPAGEVMDYSIPFQTYFRVFFLLCFSVFFLSFSVSWLQSFPKQVREARRFFD